jgi:gamma-tubulin complex component 2
MLNFIQNLLNYMTFEVFEANWSLFDENLSNVSNIDELVERHTKFLDCCLQDCILATSSYSYLYNICSACIMFVEYVESISKDTQLKEEQIKAEIGDRTKEEKKIKKQAIKAVSDDFNKIISDDHFGSTIGTFDIRFSQALLELLAKIMNEMSDNLGQSNKIGNIVNRLDFNDHYREQLEKLRQSKLQLKREQIQKHQVDMSKFD